MNGLKSFAIARDLDFSFVEAVDVPVLVVDLKDTIVKLLNIKSASRNTASCPKVQTAVRNPNVASIGPLPTVLSVVLVPIVRPTHVAVVVVVCDTIKGVSSATSVVASWKYDT